MTPDRAGAVIDVLADAFSHYPVMRWVLGDQGDYPVRLHRLVTLFVMARVHRSETLLGVPDPAGAARLVAAAIVSRPSGAPTPPAFVELREATWDTLGADARERYEAFGAATAPFEVPRPHLHLNMIGVRPGAQGRGHGRALLERVHALSVDEPSSEGVTLTTELDANERLYRKFGYEVTGRADVGGAFVTRGMWRPDPTGEEGGAA